MKCNIIWNNSDETEGETWSGPLASQSILLGVFHYIFLNRTVTFAAFCIWVFVDSHCLGKETPSVENQTLFLNISSLLWASKYWNLTSTDKKEQPTIISYNTICTVISTVMVWMKMKMKLDVPCLFMSYEVNQAHQLSNFHQSWPKIFWKMILAALPQHLINLKLDITLN